MRLITPLLNFLTICLEIAEILFLPAVKPAILILGNVPTEITDKDPEITDSAAIFTMAEPKPYSCIFILHRFCAQLIPAFLVLREFLQECVSEQRRSRQPKHSFETNLPGIHLDRISKVFPVIRLW